MNTMLNLSQTFKKLVDYALVLITILFGSMLTSCFYTERYGTPESVENLRPVDYVIRSEESNLPPVAQATTSMSVSLAITVNSQMSVINTQPAYQRGFFGQGVTIAFIDEGFSYADDGSHHAAFMHSGSVSRIVKPARFIGTVAQTRTYQGTVFASIDIFATDGRVYNLGQGNIAVAAGYSGTDGIQSGVAISASIMPVDIVNTAFGIDGDRATAIDYAADNGADIIFYAFSTSRSYLTSVTYQNTAYSFRAANFAPILDTLYSLNPSSPARDVFVLASSIAESVVEKDTVIVADTGYSTTPFRWNSVNGYVTMTTTATTGISVAISSFISLAQINSIEGFEINEAASVFFGDSVEDASNLPHGIVQVTPFFDKRLRSKFLLVTPLANNGTIDVRVGGCGASKNWCVTAPMTIANGFSSPYHLSQWQTAYSNWPPYAPAIAAGALAVIKSRIPDLPVGVARAVMLTTATDLGDPGVDAVYGHGLINIGAAISLVGSITIAVPTTVIASMTTTVTTTSSQLLVNSSIVLSPAFRNLQQQVSGLSMAVDVLGNGFYFDSPFSSVMNDDAIQNQVMTLGFAAGDMDTSPKQIGGFDIYTNRQGNLANFGFKRKQGLLNYSLCAKCKNSVWDEYKLDHQALPFFADTKRKLQGGWSFGDSIDTFVALGLDEDNEKDKYAQYGINWKGVQIGEWELAGSFSRIQEQQGYLLGSKFEGAFGIGESTSTQVGLRAQRYIEGWRMFGAVDYGKTQTDTIDRSVVRNVEGLHYAGWRLGLDKTEVFRSKDKLHFGLTKVPSVISGSMDLELSQTTGDTAYDDNLAMDYLSKTELRKHKINLEDSNAFVYRLGYSTNIHKRQRLALGFEHYTDKVNQDNTAFSAQYKVEF